jgi:putative proteasome-type protease
MTYCLAIALDKGLVFASDSRTHAGVDDVNTYRKMHTFVWDKERTLILLSAGNLATTQAVVRKLETELQNDSHEGVTLKNANTISEAAEYVGRISREIQNYQQGLVEQQSAFDAGASFIIGGQIKGQDPELYLVYPEGNFIGVSPEHPFLQIGETKYGKPILDRVVNSKMSLENAARAALVSLDSTIRSNISVGPPLDLLIYEKNKLRIKTEINLKHNHPYLAALRKQWSSGLRKVFDELPRFDWE